MRIKLLLLTTLLSGWACADTFHNGTAGNDVITGSDDTDILIASNLPSQYSYSNGSIVGVEGTDTLQSVEYLGFGYGFQNPALEINVRVEDLVDPDGDGPEFAPATEMLLQISDLYVAYFNRAPDNAGLVYWFKQVYSGQFTLFDTAKSFTDQPEYTAAYPPGLNNRDFIERIYDNLFDRIPDAEGWDYWEGQLNNGLPRDTFILTVINGAYSPTGGASDKALLINKHDACLYYVEQSFLHPEEGFDSNISQVLNNVTGDAGTVTVAMEVIDHVMETDQTLTDVVADDDWWQVFELLVGESAEDYYAQNIDGAIVQSRCITCHVEGGLSGHTPLVFVPVTDSDHLTHNFGQFSDYVQQQHDGADTILSMVQGIGHGGGIQLNADSEDFAHLQQFLELLTQPDEPEPQANRAPLAIDDVSLSFSGNLLSNDNDEDGDELTAVLVSQPGNGSVQLQANGDFVYTPEQGFSGQDSFSYQASDGELLSNVATAHFTVVAEPTEAESWFADHVSDDIIQAQCVACHVQGGLSGNTDLVFVTNQNPDHAAHNLAVLETYLADHEDGGNTILSRVQGVGHGGGVQLSSDSQGFQDLAQLLTLMGEDVCTENCTGGPVFSAAKMASPARTLRRAALIIAGRVPTDEELNAVNSGDDTTLRQTLRALMEGEGFHQFLIEGANDRLLTDKFLNNAFLDVHDDAAGFYPAQNEVLFELRQADMDDEAWMRWGLGAFGVVRGPLELIAYVVENERPYTEILTADYIMMNPYANEDYRGGAEFDDENDAQEFQPGQIQQILQDDSYESDFTEEFRLEYIGGGREFDYPHAGVLNAPVFLNRYPTTETNRNRARARWAYYHFLDLDIEKSAARTTDPEALADTDNPTMNNPACTVCHEVMDPVAGAFQNYSDPGIYRASWGGLDSLPASYKWPDEGERLYVRGDTWFRDMRTPGFEGSVAPDNSNSLQWLAQQIVNDPRFARAAVKFWWPALMGTEALSAPEEASDANYSDQLRAFEEQSADIDALATAFAEHYNLKDLLVEMLMSNWFRTDAVTSVSASAPLQDLGTERLLTPEQLDRKLIALTGNSWNEYEDEFGQRLSSLIEEYRLYYGGIDSNGVTERSTTLNTLMNQVAMSMAAEMSCALVAVDFNLPVEERRLFEAVERDLTPLTITRQGFSVAAEQEAQPDVFTTNVALTTSSIVIALSFSNDFSDEDIGDRNLILHRLRLLDDSGEAVLDLLLSDLETHDGASATTGDVFNDGWNLWSNGNVSIPFAVTQEGDYTVEVSAYGHQAGDELPQLGIAVNATSATEGNSTGAQQIKQQLQFLHSHLLGEELELDDAEIEESYQLLVEFWEMYRSRGVEGNDWLPGENTSCNLPEQFWDLDGDVWWQTFRDEDHMLKSWKSMTMYFLSDYRFLHE